MALALGPLSYFFLWCDSIVFSEEQLLSSITYFFTKIFSVSDTWSSYSFDYDLHKIKKMMRASISVKSFLEPAQ